MRARATVLMETKSYAKAVDDLDSVIRLNPHDAQGYYQRGLAHEQDGDFGKAIAGLQDRADAQPQFR